MDEVEGVEREKLLAGGDGIRTRGSGRNGRVHGILLRSTGEPESTVAGKLVAVNFFHEQWMGKTLPLNHFRIKAVKEGIKRAHVEGGTQQRMRRPLSWEMLKGMEEAAKEWGMGGRVVWIRLVLTYLLLLRASELFAEDDGRVDAVYCLRGGNVAFYAGERQVEGGSSTFR